MSFDLPDLAREMAAGGWQRGLHTDFGIQIGMVPIVVHHQRPERDMAVQHRRSHMMPSLQCEPYVLPYSCPFPAALSDKKESILDRNLMV
jgi:hypothetical protein